MAAGGWATGLAGAQTAATPAAQSAPAAPGAVVPPEADGPQTLPERTQAKKPSTANFEDPLPEYPAGSIASVEQAQAALAAVGPARKSQALRYADQRKACYRSFFSERCISVTREEDYQINRRINNVELEANAFQRRNEAATHARDREAREAKRRADEAAGQAAREQKNAGQARRLQDNQQQNADFEAKAGERNQRAADNRKREQERSAELAKKAAQEKAEAGERAARARERQAQVDEILKHAAEREARQKEKEAEKAKRLQEKAGTPAKS